MNRDLNYCSAKYIYQIPKINNNMEKHIEHTIKRKKYLINDSNLDGRLNSHLENYTKTIYTFQEIITNIQLQDEVNF